MRGRFEIQARIVAFVALASLPALAGAQSLNTWSLPEPEATSASGAQGPVDAQNPVVRPATPEASPTPTPIPTITPLPLPLEGTTTSPTEQTQVRPAPGAATRAQSQRAPETATSAGTPPATAASPEPAPIETREPSFAQDDGALAPASAAETAWPLWWWAIPAAVAAIAVALFLFRRRRPEVPEWEETTQLEPSVDAEAPAPVTEPEAAFSPPPASPLPTPAFPPPAPAPSATRDDVSLTLEPVTIRLSLFYATLQYRLGIAASSARPALKVTGDLISAHASLTREEQLAPQPDSLPVLHTLPGLVPGEKAELKGEIQLPLTAIRALRQGGGSFFVPLARFCLIGEDGTALRRVFTVGIPGSGAGLAPLRIDAGPRNFEPLAASEIETARLLPLRSLPLDPQRAAG